MISLRKELNEGRSFSVFWLAVDRYKDLKPHIHFQSVVFSIGEVVEFNIMTTDVRS